MLNEYPIRQPSLADQVYEILIKDISREWSLEIDGTINEVKSKDSNIQ